MPRVAREMPTEEIAIGEKIAGSGGRRAGEGETKIQKALIVEDAAAGTCRRIGADLFPKRLALIPNGRISIEESRSTWLPRVLVARGSAP